MSSPEIGSGSEGRDFRAPRVEDKKSLKRAEKTDDEVGRAIFDVQSAAKDVEEIDRQLALEAALKEASISVGTRDLEKVRVTQAVRKSGGMGMSGEVTGFRSEAERESERTAAVRDRVNESIRRHEQTAFVRHEETVETLTSRLDNLRARRKKLPFFNFAAKKSFDTQIQEAEDKLKAKEGEVLPDSAIEQLPDYKNDLKMKESELASLPVWQLWNMNRRTRLQEEIKLLKQRVVREKIVEAVRE